MATMRIQERRNIKVELRIEEQSSKINEKKRLIIDNRQINRSRSYKCVIRFWDFSTGKEHTEKWKSLTIYYHLQEFGYAFKKIEFRIKNKIKLSLYWSILHVGQLHALQGLITHLALHELGSHQNRERCLAIVQNPKNHQIQTMMQLKTSTLNSFRSTLMSHKNADHCLLSIFHRKDFRLKKHNS